MGVLSRIFSRPAPAIRKIVEMPRQLRARYDAAQTTSENANHWVMADSMTADAGQRPGIRRTLRMRARYESANNSYLRGITLTIANDTVGTGPTLKMNTGDAALDRIIEDEYGQWAEATRQSEKMRVMVQSTVIDGEVFALHFTNPQLDRNKVQLDFRLIEADQIASPTPWMLQEVDGIEFDGVGNPARYHLLRRHPGSMMNFQAFEYDPIPASMMHHVFRADRPTQNRGIPEVTPALPLFAMLRRYTLATLGAAETAADFAAILYTTSPANDLPDVKPFTPLDIQPRSMMAVPEGWQIGQMNAEQPTTTYPGFKTEIINEIARCLNLPFNVAACNSSSYNFSSGRLDHLIYYRSIVIRREMLRTRHMDPGVRAWGEEAARGTMLPKAARDVAKWRWSWVWDESAPVDEVASAQAQAIRLASRTTTLATEFAAAGRDWVEQLEQQSRERKMCESLGIPYPGDVQPQAEPKQGEDKPKAKASEEPARASNQGPPNGEKASKKPQPKRTKPRNMAAPVPAPPKQ